jgi:uroporphyrinogen-III decarboxylase
VVQQGNMIMEELYQQRLRRYLTAMRNEKPDRIPIRPFVAEFTGKYAGFTNQQITHDYNFAFEAARKCAADFDWDAVVGNMVYVWTGLTQALGTRYYATPGIEVGPDSCFQYLEPPEGKEFMRADEYDLLIANPTDFLLNVWLPRTLNDVPAPGQPATSKGHQTLIKGSMAMMQYFSAFGEQNRRLREECGTVSAISGILKSPLDIIADKLRGYIGLTMDMMEQPEKVMAAAEALMPHMYNVALTTADPARQVPIAFWMHRGCVPFVTPKQFDEFHWPFLKPIIENLWANGHQTLFYAEGDWGYHLDSFAELPDASIVYHVDQGDIFETHRKIGHKFCLSGGLPNRLLSFGKPDQVRDYCKKIIDEVAQDGGYIMDSGAIMQDDASVENIKVMTDFTREHGVYSDGRLSDEILRPCDGRLFTPTAPMPDSLAGIVRPWEDKLGEFPQVTGDVDLMKRIWSETDGLASMFVFQCLLSF